MKIDLNCDLGESAGNDEAIIPYITSANIACGFHAGDADVMLATVRLAKQFGVNVGAHPGWNDRQNFGRHEMDVSAQEVESIVLYQIKTLAGIAKAEHVALTHVKPHGALYNQAAKDPGLADAIARAVKSFSVDRPGAARAAPPHRRRRPEHQRPGRRPSLPDRAYNP